MKVHSAPVTTRPPRRCASGLTLRQTPWPAASSHCGWRACASSIRPQASTARWNSVQAGRRAAVWEDSQAKLSTARPAAAPATL